MLGLIGLASIGFLILAARSLRTHSYWLGTAQKLQKSIGDEGAKTGFRGQNRQLKAEIAEVRRVLHPWLVDRPQIWSNCAVQVNRANATVVAAVDSPIPHGIPASGTLFAFEEPTANSAGRYMGEFNVTKADERQIALQPAYPLTPLEMKKLSESRGPWSFYNVLPRDKHEAFATLTDEQKKAMLPAESLTEYVKDDKPADEQQDPKERIDRDTKKYVRPLRDYAQLLDHARRQFTVLVDEIESAKRDKALVDEGLADAQQQVQFAQNRIAALKLLLAKKEKERDDVAAYRDGQLQGGLLKLLTDKIAIIKGMIDETIAKNKAMAGRIAQLQLEATRLIDARTRAMAQNASGEK
ncbi:MAG: hypothetical protein IT426_04990 [Pirellulales bacterium]|nr:hypothetical protein [Pirellulales bacterium]